MRLQDDPLAMIEMVLKSCRIGGDDTLFALVDGVLRFERKGRDKKQASVYPVEQ